MSQPTACEPGAAGGSMRADHRRGKVRRRLAGDDPAVNEEWNCDKGRWGFRYTTADDRILTPQVRDPETGAVALFAVNRSTTETVTLEVDTRSIPGLRVLGATTLSNPDHTWVATADDDTAVLPRDNDSATVDGGRLTVQVPPVSWNVVRLGA